MTWMPKIVSNEKGVCEISYLEGNPHRIFIKNGVVMYRNGTSGCVDTEMNWPDWFGKHHTVEQKAAFARCLASLFEGKTGSSSTLVDPLEYRLKIVQLEADKKALGLKIEDERRKLAEAITAKVKATANQSSKLAF